MIPIFIMEELGKQPSLRVPRTPAWPVKAEIENGQGGRDARFIPRCVASLAR